MTFDERFEAEALALWARRADLEISFEGGWVPMLDQRIIDRVFSDKSYACALASYGGVKLNTGNYVRFKL